MNKNFKNFIQLLKITTLSIGAVFISNHLSTGYYLYAQTVTNAQTQPLMQVSSNGTTLTLTNISPLSEKGLYKINYTLSTASGIPTNTNYVAMEANLTFSVDNKAYQLHIGNSLPGTINFTHTEAHGVCYALCSEVGTAKVVTLSTDKINNQKASFSLKSISYFNFQNLLTYDLLDYLKTTPQTKTVPFEQGNFKINTNIDQLIAEAAPEIQKDLKQMKANELKTRPKNVLPAKRLGIKINHSEYSIDNIGFIDDKLHVRLKMEGTKYAPSSLYINDLYGRDLETYKQYDLKNGICYCVYDIKDVTALTNAQIVWQNLTETGIDEINKTSPCVLYLK